MFRTHNAGVRRKAVVSLTLVTCFLRILLNSSVGAAVLFLMIYGLGLGFCAHGTAGPLIQEKLTEMLEHALF